jgi:hypothetical protein
MILKDEPSSSIVGKKVPFQSGFDGSQREEGGKAARVLTISALSYNEKRGDS